MTCERNLSPTAQAVVLTEATLPAGTAVPCDLPADFAGHQNVQVTGLPVGLPYDATTRTISGIPAVGSDFTVSLTANDPTVPDSTNSVVSFFKTLFTAIVDIVRRFSSAKNSEPAMTAVNL